MYCFHKTFCILFALACLAPRTIQATGQKYAIAFSQYATSDLWQQDTQRLMGVELSVNNDIQYEKYGAILGIQFSKIEVQRLIILYTIILLALIVALALVTFGTFQARKNAKLILLKYNNEVEKKNKVIWEQQLRNRDHHKNHLNFINEGKKINSLEKKFLEKITNIIEKNMGGDQLSVEGLGEKMGLSRVHLYRKVKKLTDMSVSEYITSVKLRKSLDLLVNSGKTIAEIAYEVGFTSPSYYTNCFKKQFNLSPSEYIQKKRR